MQNWYYFFFVAWSIQRFVLTEELREWMPLLEFAALQWSLSGYLQVVCWNSRRGLLICARRLTRTRPSRHLLWRNFICKMWWYSTSINANADFTVHGTERRSQRCVGRRNIIIVHGEREVDSLGHLKRRRLPPLRRKHIHIQNTDGLTMKPIYSN